MYRTIHTLRKRKRTSNAQDDSESDGDTIAYRLRSSSRLPLQETPEKANLKRRERSLLHGEPAVVLVPSPQTSAQAPTITSNDEVPANCCYNCHTRGGRAANICAYTDGQEKCNLCTKEKKTCRLPTADEALKIAARCERCKIRGFKVCDGGRPHCDTCKRNKTEKVCWRPRINVVSRDYASIMSTIASRPAEQSSTPIKKKKRRTIVATPAEAVEKDELASDSELVTRRSTKKRKSQQFRKASDGPGLTELAVTAPDWMELDDSHEDCVAAIDTHHPSSPSSKDSLTERAVSTGATSITEDETQIQRESQGNNGTSSPQAGARARRSRPRVSYAEQLPDLFSDDEPNMRHDEDEDESDAYNSSVSDAENTQDEEFESDDLADDKSSCSEEGDSDGVLDEVLEPLPPKKVRSKLQSTTVPKRRGEISWDWSLPPLNNIEEIFGSIAVKATQLGFEAAIDQLQGRPLHVATMCSGTESPLIALEMLKKALGHDAKGVTYDVVHHFSAEIDDKKQAYIERNFAPQKLFRDVREFIPDDATIATTAYGSKEEIPQDIDIFIGGFVCKDLSTLNSVKKSITDDGETGDTWRAMLSYSKRNRPTIVLIENVVGRREYWNRIVAEWSAAGYEAEWRYCDTKKYYLPQTRVRMYMIAVDRQKFGSRAPAAVAQWKDTMVKLERPCSTPFAAFLKGTATEFGDTLTPPLKSEPAWVACKLKYDRIRSEERLGIKRPVTKWSENGTLRPPDHGNLRWYGTRSSREWECIDVAHLQRILSGYDTRYKMEVWDVSQSIDYYGAPLGIVGCITPSGCDFITDQQTVLTGGQMLRLQGMPNDKLLFGRESQKDLQDLAGNAMSTTVIGASLISALLCGTRYFTKKQSTTAKPLVNQVLATTLISPEASTSHAPKSMDPAAIDINSLVMDAYMTSRLCGCEGTKTVSAASVHVCKACGHTACARHAGNPAHAYTRSISKAARTQSPYEFLKKWSSVFPTRLRFASFPRDFEELVPKATKHDELVTALIKLLREVDIALQYFYISGIERDVGFWSITYTSPQAILKAKIKHGVEWNLYIKSPCTLAGNDALRKVLQQPIAQGIVEASLMTPEWRFFLPYRTTHALTIHASEEFTSSWRSREGLPDYSQETTPMMLSMASEATELEALLGDYCLQPDCGTACNSLYKKSGSENFLFLDPDLVGHPKDDCFVFSNDLARRTYGECRIASASIDPSWRPWSNQSCRSWSVQVTVPGTWLKFSPVLKPAPMSFDASIPTDSALANVSTDCTQAITILDLRVEEPLSTEELLELSWIPEQVKKIPNVGTWHDTAFVDLKCSCAPTTPSLVWNVDTDGSATAREEPKAAATFERALKVRRPVFTIHHADAKQLQIGVNIASLVHRAQGRLHTSSSSKITWRLCTDHADLAPQPFRQFSIQCNSVHDKFKGHLKLQYDLDTAQLQSLAWMKAQESGVSLTLTEVEEAIQASLGWRAESQAQSIVTVNGGVLADRPSFGKTVTTIALIQSEFQEQSAKSLLKQQSHASSIHALAATLVVCPPHIAQQWQSEFSKFLGPEQYKLYNILLIEDYAQLQQCTIEDFEKARVVIVSWSVLAEHDYIAQLAQFAAMPEPAVTEGYGFDAWMNKVTEDMPGRLEALRSEDSFTNFKLSTVKVLQERLSHAEFKDTLPLKVQHGAGYQSFRSMQDTRTTANTIKAKKKAKPQSKAPQPKHAVPFLQLFRFNRIVIDEYHYLLDDKKSENYPAYATVKCIAALNRWVLSGTPALSNFSDVNEIASFLGVKLGRDVYGDGVTMTPFEKKLVDSQTDVQKFLMRTEVMSRQWHQARHERAQEFLDLFVRKNKPSLEHIRCHEVLQPIELNLAHHAIYLELCQQLIAQRMQLKGFKSKTKSDRNDRLNAILKDSASAEDALLRGAFNVDESSITSLIKTRAVEQEIVESEIRDILIGFESLTNDDLEVSRHYDSFKKDVTSLHGLGDGDTSGRIRQLLHEAAAKAQKNPKRLPGMTGLKAVALSKALKMHISQLRELARNLVHRVRSLRFIATIKKVAPYLSSRQEPATFKCSSECTGTASIHQLRLITECGHLACEDCVTVRDNNETCLHAHCSARVTLLDMIKITDLGEPEEAEKQADHGFGNKLSAIAQLLKNTPKEDQCIVFVPNPETISDVADVLDHFNISFHALTGNKRSAAKLVEDFKNNRDEETQKKALIVNLGSESAAGTNLTNANHIIFASPLLAKSQYEFDSAMAQAIARSRRYGQNKTVHMYHFAALHTIDVDILEHRHRRKNGITTQFSTIKMPTVSLEKKQKTTLVRSDKGDMALVPGSWLVDKPTAKMLGVDEERGRFTSLINFSETFDEDED